MIHLLGSGVSQSKSHSSSGSKGSCAEGEYQWKRDLGSKRLKWRWMSAGAPDLLSRAALVRLTVQACLGALPTPVTAGNEYLSQPSLPSLPFPPLTNKTYPQTSPRTDSSRLHQSSHLGLYLDPINPSPFASLPTDHMSRESFATSPFRLAQHPTPTRQRATACLDDSHHSHHSPDRGKAP